jgi:outer membrane protein assembly factor BamA
VRLPFASGFFCLAVLLAAASAPAAGENAPSETIHIKEIRVYGNDRTLRRTILHYCEFREGDAMTQAELDRKLIRTRSNLERTAYFSRVNVFDLPRRDPTAAVIMVDVVKGTMWYLSASTRQVRISKASIGGNVREVTGDFGLDYQKLSFKPWFFNRNLEAGAGGYYASGHLTTVEDATGLVGEWFYSESFGAEGSFGCLFTRRLGSGIGVLAEEAHYYDGVFKADPFYRLGIKSYTRSVALKPYMEWDSRDDVLKPTRGLYLKAECEGADRRVGDFDYEGVKLDMRAYLSPIKGTVFAARVLAGISSDETPYVRRYNIHGADGLRSTDYYRVVGTKMLLGSAEMRQYLADSPFFEAWFEGALFVDVGRTWDPYEEVRMRDFDVATGPSLRLHMQSPMHFDWRADLNVNRELAFYATASRAF